MNIEETAEEAARRFARRLEKIKKLNEQIRRILNGEEDE